MWPLIKKDFEQHALALVIFALSILVFPFAFAAMTPAGRDPSGFIGLVFGYVIFAGPLLLCLLFIGKEKQKGTLQVLRILPLAPAKIIYAKSLATCIFCLVLLNVVLLLEPRTLTLTGAAIAVPSGLVLWGLNLLTLLAVALTIALFTTLSQSIAIQAAYGGLCGVIAVLFLVSKFSQNRGLAALIQPDLWPLLLALATVFILALSALLVEFAARFLARADWNDLEED